MASAKFSTLTMLLLINVLMILNVSPTSGETLRCYRCGPLAEELDSSRHSPPCEEPPPPHHITTCDPGENCITAAVLVPKYTESKYCLQLKGPECRPYYCNSTMTFKMVCPCNENLCNGLNTEREIIAFGLLTRLKEIVEEEKIPFKKRELIHLEDNDQTAVEINNETLQTSFNYESKFNNSYIEDDKTKYESNDIDETDDERNNNTDITKLSIGGGNIETANNAAKSNESKNYKLKDEHKTNIFAVTLQNEEIPTLESLQHNIDLTEQKRATLHEQTIAEQSTTDYTKSTREANIESTTALPKAGKNNGVILSTTIINLITLFHFI